MNNNTTVNSIESLPYSYLRNNYEEMLQARKDELLWELNQIEEDLRKLKPNGVSSNKTYVPRIIQQEINEDSSGSEIFLWGLDKIGKAATVAEVAEMISNLNIDKIKNRKFSDLKQWLTVTSNFLIKADVLERISNPNRIGGKMIKRKIRVEDVIEKPSLIHL